MCILPCYDNTHFDVLHLWFVWKFDIVVCIFFRNYRRTIINFYSFSSRVIKWACFDFKNDFFTNPLDQIRKSIKKNYLRVFIKFIVNVRDFIKLLLSSVISQNPWNIYWFYKLTVTFTQALIDCENHIFLVVQSTSQLFLIWN